MSNPPAPPDLRRLGVIVPSEGLGDFPTFYRGQDAEGLLAAWGAAWRPRLIAAAGSVPEVLCSYRLPEHEGLEANEFAGALLIVPGPAMEDEVRRWLDEGTQLLGDRWLAVDTFADEADIISAVRQSAFGPLAAPCGEAPASESKYADYDEEMAALGYARLQIAVMTGSLADSAAFDEAAFDAAAVTAARAAVAGDREAFEQALQSCYDRLSTVKTVSYPLDAWVVDTVLVSESTLGERLERELAEPTPKSVRLTQGMVTKLGGAKASLQAGVAEGWLSVLLADHAVDNDDATPWSLLPPESMADALDEGITQIESAVGAPPRVFSPWSCQLPPRLVQALDQRDFAGLMLGGFDGEYPSYCEQTKATITEPGGAELPAISRKPHDLAAAETFLHWVTLLVETLQQDPAPTMAVAGWAGCRHPMLDRLRRVARRSPLLGRFVTADDYFEQSAPAERDATPPIDLLGPTAGTTVRSDAVAPPVEKHFAAGLAGIVGVPPGELVLERCAALLGALRGEQKTGSERVVINPWSFKRVCETESGAAASVPGCGFAVATRRDTQPVDGLVMRGDDGDLEVDSASGGVRSLWVPGVRGPMLSQRLVMGTHSRSQGWVAMRAREVAASGDAVVAVGDLMDRDERRIAKFRQTTRLVPGAGSFRIAVELEPVHARAERHWVASRLVLREDEWAAVRSVQWRRLPCSAASLTAGDYFELFNDRQRVSLFGEGPIQIRRHGYRTFDASIATSLTGTMTAEFVIGFGKRHRPLPAKLDATAPAWEFARGENSPAPREGWWLHVDRPNVLVSRIEPAGEKAIRVHLIETEGRGGQTHVRLCHSLAAARLLGRETEPLPIDPATGAAGVTMPAHGWLRIELSW